MRQWFVRVNKKFALRQPTLGKWKKGDKVTLKQLMHAAVASGQTNIMPEQSRKVYFHWIDNLRDWCISRQIWFGHRVPAWYCDACDREKAIVSAEAPKKCPACGGKTLRQDEDTLDTWFSSGTWTFSTLGWPPSAKASGGRPDKTKDLKTFHPTDVLETGRDIIFFWVARMVLMSSYALGTVPFKTVYLHGLVRDEQGRKMSKSLGNIIDPLDVSAKYGTDAVRLSLVIGGTAGNDTRISDEKIAGYRNFTNKLWNVARFIAMSAPKLKSQKGKPTPKTLADKWILARLDATTAAVTKSLTAMQFSHAGETLRDFTWNELADWYLEVAKIEGQAEGGKGRKDAMLAYILRTVLALWHPFMPYVTEEIWQRLFAKGEKDLLMVATWPKGKEAKVGAAERDFEVIRETVGAIRGIRAQYKVEPGKRIDVTLTSAKHAKLLSAHAMVISTLARIEQLTVSTKAYKGTPFPQGFGGHSKTATAVVKGVTVNVPLGSLVDLEVEKKRLAEELAQAEKYAMSLEGKLGNADFIARAPAQVVAGEREKLAATKEKVAKLREQIAGM